MSDIEDVDLDNACYIHALHPSVLNMQFRQKSVVERDARFRGTLEDVERLTIIEQERNNDRWERRVVKADVESAKVSFGKG